MKIKEVAAFLLMMIAAASMDSQQQAVPGAMVLCAVSVLLGQALKNENSSKNFEDVHKRNHHHGDMLAADSGDCGSRGTGCGTGGSKRNIRGTGSEI